MRKTVKVKYPTHDLFVEALTKLMCENRKRKEYVFINLDIVISLHY